MFTPIAVHTIVTTIYVLSLSIKPETAVKRKCAKPVKWNVLLEI